MSLSIAMSLQKPQLRRFLVGQGRRTIASCVLIGVFGATLYKLFIGNVRQQKYKEFYKTYDLEKKLEIMNEAGLMQSYVIDEE